MSGPDDVVMTTVDDSLFRDDHVLVMVGSEVMLLSPVSSEIVMACGEGVALGALAEHLLAKFGPPPHSRSAVFQTDFLVQRLAEVGVVMVTAVGGV